MLAIRALVPMFLFSALLSLSSFGADGQVILGDGSGGGGGGSNSGAAGAGGAGGGNADKLTGTAGNDIIFGDGSGGGGGGRPVGTGDGAGGAAGGGADTILGGAGNDIIFGDGFKGVNANYHGGPGGLGGGGGGGAGGTFGGGPPGGGTGGLGGGGGGGGTISGAAGAVQVSGFGTSGGANGGAGGASAASIGSITGLGGSGSGAGGGGGGFGGASGGRSLSGQRNGVAGNTNVHLYADTGGTIHTYLTGQLANVFTTLPGTAAGQGNGSDTINGGAGSDDLFGLGGNDHFIFDINDAAGDTDTIWDFCANGDTDVITLLNFQGDQLGNGDIMTILAGQTANGADRTIVYTINPNMVTIVFKNIGRNLVLADFNLGRPVGADGMTAVTEDVPHTFAVNDFTYSDFDNHAFAGIQVVVASTGLMVDNVQLANGDFVKADQIAAGLFKFVPPANDFGAGLGDFSFKVFDGSLTSSTTYTQQVPVAGVNDPPTNITFAGNPNILENTAVGTFFGGLLTQDPENNGPFVYQFVAGAGDTHNSFLSLEDATVRIAKLVDFETTPVIRVRVRSTDATNLSFEKAFEFNVIDVLERAPVVDSFTATPSTAKAGETVTFTVAASDPDGTTPTVTINYGDGSSGTALTHVYAQAGDYTAVATASDGTLTGTKSVLVTVTIASNPDFNTDGFVGPMDTDSDGDGVPDAMETMLGTNPNNAADSPVDGSKPISFRMEKPKAVFGKELNDKIEFKGVLHVPAGLDPVGETLVIDGGGNVRRIVLDEKARFSDTDVSFQLMAKLNAKKAKEARFKLVITGALLENMVKNAPKDEQGRPTQLTAHILFNGSLLVQTKTLQYRK